MRNACSVYNFLTFARLINSLVANQSFADFKEIPVYTARLKKILSREAYTQRLKEASQTTDKQ